MEALLPEGFVHSSRSAAVHTAAKSHTGYYSVRPARRRAHPGLPGLLAHFHRAEYSARRREAFPGRRSEYFHFHREAQEPVNRHFHKGGPAPARQRIHKEVPKLHRPSHREGPQTVQRHSHQELPSPLLLLLLHPFYSGHIRSLYRHRFSSAPRIPDKIHILHPRTYIILHYSGRFYLPKAFSFFPLFPAKPESYFFPESLLTVIFQYTLTHHR